MARASPSPEYHTVQLAIVADGQMHEGAMKVGASSPWAGHGIIALRNAPCSGPRNTDVSINYVPGNP